MNIFLKNIAAKIYTENKSDLGSLCIVFPSRRAGIYFRKFLAEVLPNPVWAPSIMGISDFASLYSPYLIADNITLIAELYNVYKKYAEDESFDDFYPWGEMLLRDFDLTDKYLADAGKLFGKIKDLKVIEETFPLELKEEFLKFWESLIKSPEVTGVKAEFIKIWEIMGKVYEDYRAELASKKLAYEGMAFRKIYEDLKSNSLGLRHSKFVFAGFNMLNKCEEGIFTLLVNSGKAEIYWDADEYYRDNENHEAGKFIRKNLKRFGDSKSPFGSSLLADSKNITVCGTPLKLGMAKAIGDILGDFMQGGNFSQENSVLVMPDENLLLPVLYSLPRGIKELNITMGFPFRSTPLYNLVVLLKSLQSRASVVNGTLRFYHRDVIRVLLHPYVKFFSPDLFFGIVTEIRRRNISYVDVINLAEEVKAVSSAEQITLSDTDELFTAGSDTGLPAILSEIFRIPADSDSGVKNSPLGSVSSYLSRILSFVAGRIEKEFPEDNNYRIFQLEYIYTFSTNLNRLCGVLSSHGLGIEEQTFWRILLQALGKLRISFTGEPLKGFQIMGMLETRCLGFDNVFILSVNEGVLPPGNTFSSFIPYSLRKPLGMPVYEDNDANTAYNFYRLIQNAKNIYLLYDTETGEDSKEKSRFILQLEQELVRQNKKINYSHKILSPPSEVPVINEIKIEKSGKVIERLRNIRRFSASDLSTYINCSLQFYFSRVLGLEEEAEVEEIFSAAAFGSIFHGVMYRIYEPYLGKTVSDKDIGNILVNFEKDFDGIFESVIQRDEKLRSMDFNLKGRNTLYKTVIRNLVSRLLGFEKASAPFKIISLEKSIETELVISRDDESLQPSDETPAAVNASLAFELSPFVLKGRLDRLDSREGMNRIIDYKTGTQKLKGINTKNKVSYFGNLISGTDYREDFQMFFYAYVWNKLDSKGRLNAGTWSMRDMESGVRFIVSDNDIPEEYFTAFGIYLKKLITEIFNPDIPFAQTEDENNCRYCAFRSMCFRG